jgi:hypothetical protein
MIPRLLMRSPVMIRQIHHRLAFEDPALRERAIRDWRKLATATLA